MPAILKEKTNIDYLRHILDTLGNLMGPDNYKESIEWLDAIQNELDVANEKQKACESELTDKEDEIYTLEEKVTSLQNQIEEEKEERDYEDEIDTGMEPLRWSCGNIAIKSMMEALEEKLPKVGHRKIENILNAL